MPTERGGVTWDPTPNAGSILGYPIVGGPAAEGDILVFHLAPSPGWYAEPGGVGGGDMFKATYDADNDTVVDNANAVRISGINIAAGVPLDGTAVRYDSVSNTWLYVYVPASLSHPGNPNGIVDGNPGDLLRDTVNTLLWWKSTARGTTTGWILT